MNKIKPEELYSLEEYAKMRKEYRARIMEHKRNRVLQIGPNVTLHFEDRLLMQYQVQEMLRAERIFEQEGIQEELDAYNPLIPDGRNWKATFMIEYPDKDERQKALAKLIGIEDKVWVQVADFDKVYAIADEDLERESAEKTSSVHFLRFELSEDMAQAVNRGAAISVGIDHKEYQHALDPVPENARTSLAADIDA